MPEEFLPIQSQEEYDRYFKQLKFVFEKLLQIFETKAGKNKSQDYEAGIIADFLNKMLYTISVFVKKYTYNPAHSLKVDITDSGFPSFYDISNLSSDILNKEERLLSLPTLQALKQDMLDHMFKHKTDPTELLIQASERSYFNMLDQDRLFMAFTPTKTLKINRKDDKFRNYTFSWACYDFATNRPYINIMVFDQDADAPPLENKETNFYQVMDVIRAEGSRAPSLGVLAVGIDTNIKEIHPKVIKRICIGPICSKWYSKDPTELYNLIITYGENEDDFIMLFEDEIIFSVSQKVSKSFFSQGQVRESFFIPETDLECYKRKSSKIHKYLLLPHTVLQHMDINGDFREYADHEKISYGSRGELYIT